MNVNEKLIVVLAISAAIGCNRGGTPATPSSASTTARSADTPPPSSAPVAQARIDAIAVFRGTPPAPKRLKTTPDCGAEPFSDGEVLVRGDGALSNVVVRVVGGVPAATASGIGAEIVQERCQYSPRVAVIQAGQDLRVTSRDAFLHNVHAVAGSKSVFNKGQATVGTFVKEFADLGTTEGPLELKCDVHPWMISSVFVHTNPYFAVTGESGTATILAPPGELTLEAWHETLGTRRQTVKAGAGAPVSVTFEY